MNNDVVFDIDDDGNVVDTNVIVRYNGSNIDACVLVAIGILWFHCFVNSVDIYRSAKDIYLFLGLFCNMFMVVVLPFLGYLFYNKQVSLFEGVKLYATKNSEIDS